MKKLLTLITLFILALNVTAQKNVLRKVADSINAEGETLYRSEWASGHSTQIFTSSFGVKKQLSGGYFSYETEKKMTTVFFSKNNDPVVLATVKFGHSLDSSKYSIDTTTRKFTVIEKDLYASGQKLHRLFQTTRFLNFIKIPV
jgi:hypothetical protein